MIAGKDYSHPKKYNTLVLNYIKWPRHVAILNRVLKCSAVYIIYFSVNLSLIDILCFSLIKLQLT